MPEEKPSEDHALDDRTVLASAPLRISLVGGGTDFPHYYEAGGGAVLSITIDHHAHVSMRPRHDNLVSIRSLDLGRLVEYRVDEAPVFDGALDLVKAAIRRFDLAGGVDVQVRSDAPAGSGLGGSSALTTAVVAALAALVGRRLGRHELAELSYRIEREDLGIAGGKQDQYATTFGGLNLIEFSAAGVAVTPVVAAEGAVSRLHERLLLCYTGGVRTNLGLIDTQIRLFREGREETILGMKQLHELVYAMRDALVTGDVEAVGAMLHEAHESKKLMNPHIADETPIEQLFEAARRAGAAGGKICGAGGGGYLLLYCEPGRRSAVRAELERLGGQLARFAFTQEGVRARVGDLEWRPDPTAA